MSYQVPVDFREDNELFLDLNDSESADVFLLRVPKGFDIARLNGIEFSSNEIKQLEVEGVSQLTGIYELGAFCGQGLDVSALVKSNETVVLGTLVTGPTVSEFLAVTKSYRENLESESSRTDELSSYASLPDGLRVRFTPDGAGSPIKHAQSVRKKKKKKRKHSDVTLADVSIPDILHNHKRQKTHEEADSPQQRHKKHKHKKKGR
ncbi:hypothetical protein BsWGS_12169 [Bradybaena similaris]